LVPSLINNLARPLCSSVSILIFPPTVVTCQLSRYT
jgi:hypothetical protein